MNDFYRHLAVELGVQPTFRKTDNFKIIRDEINRLVVEKRQTSVIIIDEADYIRNVVLNGLKMLFNFEMDPRDRAVILLCGLPQLNSTLRLSIREPFRQGVVMSYNLEGVTKTEGHSYITEKLNGAGYKQTASEGSAFEAILNAANGIPRMINKLCNVSLLVASSSGLNLITSDVVTQAINDCELGQEGTDMEFTYLYKWHVGTTVESRIGTICPLMPFDCTDYKIASHGSCFHLVIGEHCYGKYIYIPTWNIVMDISSMEDRLWNREHLMRNHPELPPVDIISIVEALATIKKYTC